MKIRFHNVLPIVRCSFLRRRSNYRKGKDLLVVLAIMILCVRLFSTDTHFIKADNASYLNAHMYFSSIGWATTAARVDGSSSSSSIQQQQHRLLPMLEHCPSQDWNETCAEVFKRNLQILDQCLQRPSLPQCTLSCFDVSDRQNPGGSLDVIPPTPPTTTTESSSLSVNSSTTTTTNSLTKEGIWPLYDGIGQRWVEDIDYCQNVINTTQSCLQDKYRFQVDAVEKVGNNNNIDNIFHTFDAEEACAMLARYNVTDIHVVGDSLARHFAQGLAIVLSGYWDLQFDVGNPNCYGDYAFAERGCRSGVSNNPRIICDGQINLKYEGHNPRKATHVPKIQDASPSKRPGSKTLHFYGVGNHPASGQGHDMARLGILNSEQWSTLKWNEMNYPNFWGTNGYFVWLPPHYKMNIGRHDETNQRAYAFGLETHNYFSKLGGITVNTYDMTKQLSSLYSRSCPPKLNGQCLYYTRDQCDTDDDDENYHRRTFDTWDGYHYSRTINAWKAHLALYRFMLSRRTME